MSLPRSRAVILLVSAGAALTACTDSGHPATESATHTQRVAEPDPGRGPTAAPLRETAWGMAIPEAPIDRSNEAEMARQWWTAKASCLTENGFPAHYDGEGITITGGGSDQREARRAQSAACHEAITERLGPLPTEIPYSADELRAQHALLVESADCLRQRGYPPSTEPPSVDAFMANEYLVYAGNEQALDDRWSPYPEDPNAYLRAEVACPYPMGPEITAWLADKSP